MKTNLKRKTTSKSKECHIVKTTSKLKIGQRLKTNSKIKTTQNMKMTLEINKSPQKMRQAQKKGNCPESLPEII